MFGSTPSYLPKKDTRSYHLLSAFLYLLFLIVLFYGALSFLFPYYRYNFDFNNPDATKNELFEPHLSNFEPVVKGKVAADNTLSLYTDNPHILEGGDVIITPTEGSMPFLEGTQVKVKKGWAATFFPQEEAQDIPKKNIVEYQGNYYEWREDTLYPFVSKAAAASYIPEGRITSLAENIFSQLTISDELIGFRPGTLLAYADGVFFVTEEGTIRPFGSAEVLTRQGYTFDHVLPASGEDVGIYKRGKIILPGELNLGGTLFYDMDSQTTYLFQNKKMFPLTKEYAQFLSAKNDVIPFSKSAQAKETSCILKKKPLRNLYGCHFNLLALTAPGNDYQFTLTDLNQDVDIQDFFVGLQPSRKEENAKATLRSLFLRILERAGLY